MHDIINPMRCYKCQKRDHYATACEVKGTKADIRKKCIKCSQEGHIAKDCNNLLYCYECEEEAHQAAMQKH